MQGLRFTPFSNVSCQQLRVNVTQTNTAVNPSGGLDGLRERQ